MKLKQLMLASSIALAVLALTAGMVLALSSTPVGTDGVSSPGPATDIREQRALARHRMVPLGPATVPYTTLVDAQPSEPETLDPHWMYDASGQRVAAQVYETLLVHEREDPIAWVPQLATAWQISTDVRTYTFTIRSGVTFHEGGTLEPHDVAYSFWRALIQDRDGGPVWLLLGPLFGVGRVDDLPGDDPAKCQAVKDAVTYDDAGGTVTFHLSDSYAPFLDILALPLGSILDQEWMAASGGWDGSCADWRDYHNPSAGLSILYDRMNGTGPYNFSHWNVDEIRLVRHESYWRHEPIWNGGPSGPAALEALVLRRVPDAEIRRDMLISGDADIADVPSADIAELEHLVWGIYDGYDDLTPTLVNPTGTLRLFVNLPRQTNTPMMFCYDIDTDANSYIGSGALDGDGIPSDFFTDIHVRKAFNYAMDWTAVISAVSGGEAIQSRGPIPKGVLGYTDAQLSYLYSPTLSIQEFQQAWGGQLWSQGFSMTLMYNEGNNTRRQIVETLARNIEAITDTFHVGVISDTWPVYLDARESRRLPIYTGGWIEEFHHPHDWVYTFLHSGGPYMRFQTFPATMAAQFDAKIDECVRLTDVLAAQTCYEDLQHMSYVSATAMWGVQPVGRHYERMEVRGYYFNPAYLFSYYYALSKGAPPSIATISHTLDNTVHFSQAADGSVTLDIPAGAVSETTVIVHTPDIAVVEARPGGFRRSGLTFELQACQRGECLGDYAFDKAITATLHYSDTHVEGLIGDELYLYTWNRSAWVDTVTDCGWPLAAYQRHPEVNQLIVPLCHFTRFAMVGATRDVYLPLVLRDS